MSKRKTYIRQALNDVRGDGGYPFKDSEPGAIKIPRRKRRRRRPTEFGRFMKPDKYT